MGTTMTIDEGFRRLRKAIGVPEGGPNFPEEGERIKGGEMVTVILSAYGIEKTGRARATGKRTKGGEHILWYRDERNRKWRLKLDRFSILLDR